MKRIIAIGFIIAGSIVSCKKEVIEPTNQDTCNCGRILSDDVKDLSVVIRNSCTGNNKKFILYEGDWINSFVGSDMCITGAKKW